MRINFLGTGPTEAIPREKHIDILCREARKGGKSRRMRSAALVSNRKTNILIDMGPDIFKQLSKARPKALDAVLITHGHEDAIGGLPDLDRWLSKNMPPDSPKIPIHTDRLTAERLTTRFGKPERLDFVHQVEFKGYYINDVLVIPVPVLHTHDERSLTFGYRFEDFCYASDFYGLPKKTLKMFQGVRTAIFDGAMYLGVKMPTHMSADATVRLAAELDVRTLILTQSGHTYPPHEKAEKAIQAYSKKFNPEWPKNIRLAYDGMKASV